MIFIYEFESRGMWPTSGCSFNCDFAGVCDCSILSLIGLSEVRMFL